MNDSAFDNALRQALQVDAEPDDAGFSLRVMAALPPKVSGARALHRRLVGWAQMAHWAALSVAACAAALLLSLPAPSPDSPEAIASLALIGLIVMWSLPTRWSRV